MSRSDLELEMKRYNSNLQHSTDLEQLILVLMDYCAFLDEVVLEIGEWRTDGENCEHRT